MYDARRSAATGLATASLTGAGIASTLKTFEPLRIWRFCAYVTTATVSTGNIVVQLLSRPTAGSATGQTVVGTLTIPTGVTANKVYYKDVTPVNVPAGVELAYNVLTAAAGGGAAGSAVFEFLADFSPETVSNESNFVASA